ncbi:MAG: DUF4026 domain-containing protein [Sedimentisphaerales bacterium]|nr:DUF4026 domain-containing protein [Sedimentisphaerales bacterium]
MFDWFRKKVPCVGEVLFRGKSPIQAHEFTFLRNQGIAISQLPSGNSHRWALQLVHPEWGQAVLACHKTPLIPDRMIYDVMGTLTEKEKQTALAAGTTVGFTMEGQRENLLQDRKNALRYMRAIMGEDGLAVMDVTGHSVWSKEMLDDELEHDADLDIEQIYSIHAVYDNEDQDMQRIWIHTHGLGEIGFFDFDMFSPSDDLWVNWSDLFRFIAFAIAENRVTMKTDYFKLFSPGGFVSLVPVREFQKKAARQYQSWREENDPHHMEKRVVLCEPRGFLERWTKKICPSRVLSKPLPEDILIDFSVSATRLMEKRARQTYPTLRRLREEFHELGLPILVKIGYQTDGGDETNMEHLWFSVNKLYEDQMDATLENEPFRIACMKKGDRGRHPIEQLTDWIIMTPMGTINPRKTLIARRLREDPEVWAAVKKVMEEGEN